MTKNGTLKNVKGDVTRPQRIDPKEVVVIPHVCNNFGCWGAGFVLALNERFSTGPRSQYIKHCGEIPVCRNRLGFNSYMEITEDEGKYLICNMIAQESLIAVDNPRPLKYDALVKCMVAVAQEIKRRKQDDLMFNIESQKYVIHCPKFGSELAGGSWIFILELIRDIWLENGINVVVYEFEPDKSKWG